MIIHLNRPVTLESVEAGARAFWTWWSGEILSLLPEKWRCWLQGHLELPQVRLQDGEWRLTRAGQEADAESLAVIGRTPVRLELPERDILRRTIRLPRGAESRLRGVIALQIERLCPFRADQVVFDSEVDVGQSDKAEIAVAIAIVPRKTLEDYVSQFAAMGCDIGGFETKTGRRLGLNSNLWRRDPRLMALAIAALGLFVLAAGWFLAPSLRDSEIQREEARLAAVRSSAAEALRAKTKLDTLLGPAEFATRLMREPDPLDVLKTLTAAFPSDAKLNQLEIDGRRVVARGTSRFPSSLPTVLKHSPRIASAAPIGGRAVRARGPSQFELELTVR